MVVSGQWFAHLVLDARHTKVAQLGGSIGAHAARPVIVAGVAAVGLVIEALEAGGGVGGLHAARQVGGDGKKGHEGLRGG